MHPECEPSSSYALSQPLMRAAHVPVPAPPRSGFSLPPVPSPSPAAISSSSSTKLSSSAKPSAPRGPPAPTDRPRPKTSSERGRLFRARQRLREAALTDRVTGLRDQVAALERSRRLQEEHLVRRRHVPGGSLARVAEELFTRLRRGLAGELTRAEPLLAPPVADAVARTEAFIHHVVDPEAVVADLMGPAAVIDQWRRYTLFHEGFATTLRWLEHTGTEDAPRIRVHFTTHVGLGWRTFDNVFPRAVHRERLRQTFLHRRVDYECIVTLGFGPDGRIDFYGVEVDFIGGLRRAGASLVDVGAMLEGAEISAACTLRGEGAEQLSGMGLATPPPPPPSAPPPCQEQRTRVW